MNANEPIIDTLLQQDLYKLTMQQVVFHQYPNAIVRYKFVCRNKGIREKLGFLADDVRREVDALANLRFTDEEAEYLRSYPFFKNDYIEFLKTFRMNPSLLTVKNVNGELVIKAEGKWIDTILFEIFVLSIVNELYFRVTTKYSDLIESAMDRLDEKIEKIKNFPQLKISEFGTRRRYSKVWQEYVLRRLIQEVPNNIVGTSNVYLAKKLGIRAHGTMAHEFISAHLGLVEHISDAQKRAFYSWLEEYDNSLGTALTDTFTTKAFFRDFGVILSNGFSGMRHDSGDPFEFGRNCIAHYKKMGIDPRTKFLIFSDGLDVDKAIEIWKAFAGEIGLAFGIGTNLTNDMSDEVEALNIVMKLIWCNGTECVKLSDNPGKIMGDLEMAEKVKKAYMVNT